MSDVMLMGVLKMPYELAMSSELSRLQFHGRAQEAAERIESLQAKVAELERDAKRFEWIEENCRSEGGGRGFTVFVPVDHEDIGCGIDAAIEAAR